MHTGVEATAARKSPFPMSPTDLSMLFVAVIWGVNFAVVKQTLNEIAPLAFASIRFVLASFFILLYLRTQKESLHLRREDVWKVVLMGLLGITISQAFMVRGIAQSTAGNASLLVATNPLFVTLFSVALGVEGISLGGVLGIILSFAGVAIIMSGAGSLDLSNATLTGNLLILVSCISWAVYTLLAQSLSRRYSPLKVTTLGIIVGTPFLVLISAGQLLSQDWGSVSVAGWLGLCYSFMFAGVIAFVMWTVSLHRAGNTRTAIFSNLVPVIAVLVSWLFLHESLHLWVIVGAVVTLIGVTITRVAPRAAAGGMEEFV